MEALRAAGLAQGGSEENALVIGPEGYWQPPRFPDEPVRHKALDLLGDLALCGFRVRAQVTAGRPSHRLNVALARALRDQSGGVRVLRLGRGTTCGSSPGKWGERGEESRT